MNRAYTTFVVLAVAFLMWGSGYIRGQREGRTDCVHAQLVDPS